MTPTEVDFMISFLIDEAQKNADAIEKIKLRNNTKK